MSLADKKQLSQEDLEDIIGGFDVTKKVYGTLVYKEHKLGANLTRLSFAPYPYGTSMTVINAYFTEKLKKTGCIFVEFIPGASRANA